MIINYVENGDSFIEYESHISVHYSEITKELYDEIKNSNYGEVSKAIQESLSDAVMFGYGYYGFLTCEKDGKYYLGTKIGNSCD